MIDCANDASIGLRFVSHNRPGSVQPHTLNSLVQKRFSGLRVLSCGQAKIDHLIVRAESPPQVAPLAIHPEYRFHQHANRRWPGKKISARLVNSDPNF